jgi:hypothetical protein
MGTFSGHDEGPGMTTNRGGDQQATDSSEDRASAEWNAKARGESEAQRLDRNLMELLQELRVAQTGIQILFAFLLTLPFSARFADTTAFQRNVYVATLMCAAGATALLIAPVSMHRFVFRQRKKKQLVAWSNRFAHGGLLLLALSVVGSVLVVLEEVAGPTGGRWLTVVVAVWFGVFWYVSPMIVRYSDIEDDLPDDDVSSVFRHPPKDADGSPDERTDARH